MHDGERFNSATHLLGLILAVVGSVVLLREVAGSGDAHMKAAAVVFSLAMLALYAASTLYHSTLGRAKRWWRRADHCAIYLLIAGTYTPLALVTLEGPVGWCLLIAIWACAVFGIARELRAGAHAQPSLVLCLGMGWLWLLVAVPLAARMETAGLAWLLAGAASYSVGTIFYRNADGLRHAHGVWHLFVLGGTACHYAAIAGFVL